jgi:hypothetical protein
VPAAAGWSPPLARRSTGGTQRLFGRVHQAEFEAEQRRLERLVTAHGAGGRRGAAPRTDALTDGPGALAAAVGWARGALDAARLRATCRTLKAHVDQVQRRVRVAGTCKSVWHASIALGHSTEMRILLMSAKWGSNVLF